MVKSFIKIFFLVIVTFFWTTMILISTPINYKGKVSNFIVKIWSKNLLAISFIKVKIAGVENIKDNQNYIYISNHSSLFDILITLAAIPSNIRFVAKKQIFNVPLFGWAMRVAGYISVDRSRSVKAMRSIEAAAAKIRSGLSVIMFAEGTRSKDGSIQPFKRGPFLLAAKTNVPIIPVTINGAERVLPKDTLRLSGGKVEIVFGEQIPTINVASKNDELELLEKVKNVIIKNKKGI
jgi:1-acyl-sn-glycerol-3-phosphate acyltransferase